MKIIDCKFSPFHYSYRTKTTEGTFYISTRGVYTETGVRVEYESENKLQILFKKFDRKSQQERTACAMEEFKKKEERMNYSFGEF